MFYSKVFQSSTRRCFSSKSIVLSERVKQALCNHEPIVALESTIVTHGMPKPHNVSCAKGIEKIIESNGAVPATIAMLKGQVHVGLSNEMLENLANDENVVKVSRRDFPIAISKKMSGGTTVAGTMMVANKVGIPIFVTGGLGGVHRQGETTMDISADLTELGRTPVAVISAGIKSVLDIGRTLEYLAKPVVVGGSNFDIICKVGGSLTPNASTVDSDGLIQTAFGGVGRNLADALALLDCQPHFISTVGSDPLGQCILHHNSKLDKKSIHINPSKATATYCLTLTNEGDLNLGFGDFAIHQTMTPEMIMTHEEIIKKAPLVILDANFSQEAMDKVLELCCVHQVPVFFEPTDPTKSVKAFQSPWQKAIKYASPNIHELRFIANSDKKGQNDPNEHNLEDVVNECTELAKQIKAKTSISTLLVTLGVNGVLVFEGQNQVQHFKVSPEENVVSVSGAGDCLAAGFIAGLLKGHDTTTSVEFGLRAASLSLKNTFTVPNELSMQMIQK